MIKFYITLIATFLFINIFTYTITEYNKNIKIDNIIVNNIKMVETHIHILDTTQKNIAYAIFKSILRNTNVINDLDNSYGKSDKVKESYRIGLSNLLQEQYETAKLQGILQIQFVYPDNISFLRLHKTDKFGDDLTNIREDFKIVNSTLKSVRGFSQGKTSHGFRNVFPIFNKNNKHVGAMEISFSSDKIQWYLMNVSNIHAHVLVKKNIFMSNEWDRDDVLLNYQPSAESNSLLISLDNKIHTAEKCINVNKIRLKPIRKKLDFKLSQSESFGFYLKINDKTNVLSFIPIKNIKGNKVVAWVVAYRTHNGINSLINITHIIRFIILISSIILIYFLLKQAKIKQMLKSQNTLVNTILDTTDNIMFITDFETLYFSNKEFKKIIDIEDDYIFNKVMKEKVIDIFNISDGFLHQELLKPNESFIELIRKTPAKDRIVSINDKDGKHLTFTIGFSRISEYDKFLITLANITDIKDYQDETEKKVYLDKLTNIFNRAKFDELIDFELKSAIRYNTPTTLAILDIDNFKYFNDQYGHLIGDKVLITMTSVVTNTLRETDIFARWGGEEFVILFKNTDIKTAEIVSNKLRNNIEAKGHSSAGKITVSFGLTQVQADDNYETIFERCDRALYTAKRNGRNRVEIL